MGHEVSTKLSPQNRAKNRNRRRAPHWREVGVDTVIQARTEFRHRQFTISGAAFLTWRPEEFLSMVNTARW